MDRRRLQLIPSTQTQQSLKIQAGKITKAAIFLAMLLLTTTQNHQPLSDVFFSFTQSGNLCTCGSAGTLYVEYINTSGFPLTSQVIRLDFPDGVQYVEGSLTDSSGYHIMEDDLSNLSAPEFIADNLEDGGTIRFAVSYEAGIDAMVTFLSQGNLRTSVTVESFEGIAQEDTDPYSITYPSISIGSVNPTAQTISVGDTASRSFTLTNNGTGYADKVYIADLRGAGLELFESIPGTIPASGDTIYLSGIDFTSVGDGDSLFDPGESISIDTRYIPGGCSNASVTSSLSASWGCSQQFMTDAATSASISVSQASPSLSISAGSSLPVCLRDNSTTQSLTITNSGGGTAHQVEVNIFNSTGGVFDQSIFARIDTGSITWQEGVNGIPQAISPDSLYFTSSGGNYACLGNNPVGGVVLGLPNISAGATLIIKWETYHCCINACDNEVNTGWKYSVDYSDGCGENTRREASIGQLPLMASASLFAETPSDIGSGQTEKFTYSISGFTNTFPSGNEAYYELVYQLPEGIIWPGNSTDLGFENGPNTWDASSAVWDSENRTVTARYDFPLPFTLEKAEAFINLTGDCAGSAGEKSISLSINYIPDGTCNSVCSTPVLCNETTTVELHCGSTCTEGMEFNNFHLARTSFGSPDNNQDGLPDSSGDINREKVKINRVMTGDTLRATMAGVVHTSGDHSAWAYGYAKTTIAQGSNFQLSGATVRVFDASEGTYFSCSSVSSSNVADGTDQIFSFDISPATLSAGCSDFSAFTYEEGDSVWLFADYKVTGNIGASIATIDVDNRWYLSEQPAPAENAQFGCDSWGGRITLIGYYFTTDAPQNITVTGCSEVVSQNFYLGIGDCCSNYQGGNIFPYEYRNWARVKEARVVIPENYSVTDAYLTQRRTKFTNTGVSETVNNLMVANQQQDTLWYNLSATFNSGALTPGDDGFSGTLFLELTPSCDVPSGNYEDINWSFNFETSAILGGETTDWYTSANDRIQFNPTTVELDATATTVEALGRTVSWEVTLSNSGQDSLHHVWLHLKSPSGDENILSVVESGSETVSLTGDIYRIGSLAGGQTRTFTVMTDYSSCSNGYVQTYSGFECSGYPENFAAVQCDYSQLELHYQPQSSALEVTLADESTGQVCGEENLLTFNFKASQKGYVDGIEISVELPSSGGLAFVSGTAELKYPLTSSFFVLPDPVITGNGFTYRLADHQADIDENGLPGNQSTPLNQLQFRFQVDKTNDYQAGDHVLATITSERPCGPSLDTTKLSFLPGFRFVRDSISGLSTDAGNSWGGAWGDFNGDGYDDLYVPEYNHWQPGLLYKNEGDGTFSKVQAEAPVTDLGSGTGATWGDYDNDGDLDLFAANNTRAENHLYENEGNGEFRKINGGQISHYGGFCHNASWVDFDNDGWLDVFASDYMPMQFNQMYRNKGNGTFERMDGSPITMEAKYSMGSVWSDYDNDGLPDLFVTNGRNENNSLYHNEGNGEFTKILSSDIVNDQGNSVGASWGDFDNDGDFDLYVTNASDQNNFFYINNGDGTFTKNTSSIIAQEGGHSHGSTWGDVDNDGDLDLLVTNNGGNTNKLYLNHGNGTFSLHSHAVNTDMENSMSSALIDYDNDGDLDIYISNNGNTSNTLYINELGACNNFKCFRLEGSNSNRSAIGAKVRVKAKINGINVWQVREIMSQTGGTSAQGSLKAHFGLGDASKIDSVIIQWPSGYIQYMKNVGINDCEYVLEETGVEISGTVYYDENQNCVRDSGEIGIPNILLKIMPGQRYVSTNQYGEYKTYRESGNYTIRQVDNTDWNSHCTQVHQVNTNGVGGGNDMGGHGVNPPPKTDNDFANIPYCENPDLGITMSGTILRVGYRNSYTISVTNHGAKPATNFDLVVAFDKHVIPLSANIDWDSYTPGDSSNKYYWSFNNLKPGERTTIFLIDSVSTQAQGGATATNTAWFENNDHDCDETDNTVTDISEFNSSLDPNDILVYPEGSVRPGDTLTYKIRFQNVGNSYATHVRIKDTLDQALDLSSLVLGASSHPVSMELADDGVLTFRFDYIMLKDSISNEPESHGFVQYKVATHRDIPEGRLVKNRAAIQFDYNDYIITNTVVNTIADTWMMARENKLKLVVSPNPVSVEGAVARITHTENPDIHAMISACSLYTTTGVRIFNRSGLATTSVSLQREGLSAGIYILEVYDQYGYKYSAKVVLK